MRDAKTSFQDAAARLDEFLKRAAADFGSNETDRAKTERRVDEHLLRQQQCQSDPLRPAA
jgi:hypothetical protein